MLSPWAMCSPNFIVLLVVSGSIQMHECASACGLIAISYVYIHAWPHVLWFFPGSSTHGLMDSTAALVSKFASIDLQVWPHIDG